MRGVTVTRKPNGRWEVRWREPGCRRGRTFDRKTDADTFALEVARRRQLGGVVDLEREQVTLAEFIETYWLLHAIPNLQPDTREQYKLTWAKHLHDRIGDTPLRQITPPAVTRLRVALERDKVSGPTVIKALTVLQSILTVAVHEGHLDYNPVAQVRKPRAKRERTPHHFTPLDVERLAAALDGVDRIFILLLAYTGARPEEVLRLLWRDVGEQALHFLDTKRHTERHTPLLTSLAGDLRRWKIASPHPTGPREPIVPAHDDGPFDRDDYRNWRKRTWRPLAPDGSRPRDLRSSYITLEVYAGTPLTTIARNVGTSVAMIDYHYASVLANVNTVVRTSPEDQIMRARAELQREAG